MCRCTDVGCRLTPAMPSRNHFCTTCGRAHYQAREADDCCDHDVTADEFD